MDSLTRTPNLGAGLEERGQVLFSDKASKSDFLGGEGGGARGGKRVSDFFQSTKSDFFASGGGGAGQVGGGSKRIFLTESKSEKKKMCFGGGGWKGCKGISESDAVASRKSDRKKNK